MSQCFQARGKLGNGLYKTAFIENWAAAVRAEYTVTQTSQGITGAGS